MTRDKIIEFIKSKTDSQFIEVVVTPLDDGVQDIVFRFEDKNDLPLSFILEEKNGEVYCPYNDPKNPKQLRDTGEYLEEKMKGFIADRDG